MNPKKLDIGMIFFPSLRSLAYLNIFKRCNCYPSEMIILSGSIPHYEAIHAETLKLGYTKKFFDTALTVEKFCKQFPVTIRRISANSINSPELLEILSNSSLYEWIFSGGGIIQPPFFKIGKRFIHIHPGIIPEYRGSTTFYYSILEEGRVGVTAFCMTEDIDNGEIIAQRYFSVNMNITGDNALFIDYVLDPYVRGELLGDVLKQYLENGKLSLKPVPLLDKPTYFVIHPFLRHLAILKLNNQYDATMPSGIFGVEESL